MTLLINYCCLLFILVTLCHKTFSKSSFFKGPPTLLSEKDSQKKTVNEGKDVKLICPATGNPIPIIEWSKEGEAIPEDGWERFRAVKTSLKIKEVTAEDQGKYVCKAVNGFGIVQFTFHLTILASLGNVLTSPTGKELRLDRVFPVSGSTLRKISGQSVQFKCIAIGDPTPEIIWLKNGQVLDLHHESREEDLFMDLGRDETPGSSLSLVRLTPENSGNYTCLATNIHGNLMANWTLNVVGKLSSEGAEIFQLDMPNVTTFSGESATLSCKGAWDSNIRPKVMWLRQITEQSIPTLPQNHTFPYKGKHYQVLQPTELTLLENGHFMSKLVIETAQIEDSGLYVCTVSNRLGVSVRRANLTVIESGTEGAPIFLVSGLTMGAVVISAVAGAISIYRRKSKPSRPLGLTESALISPAMGTGSAKLQPAPASRQPRYIVHPPPNFNSHSLQPSSDTTVGLSYPPKTVHISSRLPQGNETPVGSKEQQQPIIMYHDPNLSGSVYLASHQRSQVTQPPKVEYRQFDVI